MATRVVCDGNQRFDRVPAGFSGDLWIELIPRSFDIRVAAGVRLTQMIFFAGRDVFDHSEIVAWHHRDPLVFEPDGTPL